MTRPPPVNLTVDEIQHARLVVLGQATDDELASIEAYAADKANPVCKFCRNGGVVTEQHGVYVPGRLDYVPCPADHPDC